MLEHVNVCTLQVRQNESIANEVTIRQRLYKLNGISAPSASGGLDVRRIQRASGAAPSQKGEGEPWRSRDRLAAVACESH